MKKIIFVLVIIMTFAGSICAQLKIGYVDSDAVLEQYSGMRAAEEEFNKFRQRLEQESSRKEESIRKMQETLEKQALLLSEDRRRQMQKDIQDSVMSYQKFLQDKFGQQGEAAQKNNELLRPIVERINTIIRKIATDENYDFIFDSKAGLIHAKKSYDLTDKVIRALNSGR